MTRPTSAIPDFYYFCFAVFEPFLTIVGFAGAWFDPQATYNAQAPWPSQGSPPDTLPTAALVTVMQLAHVCALVGIVNVFVLTSARWHLHSQPAVQEKIAFALFTPLLIGDILHIYVTLWALGDRRWDVWTWTPMLWATVLIGLSIMLPRIAWHLGIRRYVDTRDSIYLTKATNRTSRKEKL